MVAHVYPVLAASPAVNWLTGWRLMGFGGGIRRDVMVGQVPAAIRNPAHLAFAVGYVLRVAALYRGRPLLGRKNAGKSQRELRDLGLLVENGDGKQEGRVPAAAGTH
jgi:hypothetical protein